MLLEDRLGQFREAMAAARSRYPGRFGIQAAGEIRHIGDPHSMAEIREHRRVIGRIAGEHHALADRVQRHMEDLAKQLMGHRQLVVIAEPAIDMDRADLGPGAAVFEYSFYFC